MFGAPNTIPVSKIRSQTASMFGTPNILPFAVTMAGLGWAGRLPGLSARRERLHQAPSHPKDSLEGAQARVLCLLTPDHAGGVIAAHASLPLADLMDDGSYWGLHPQPPHLFGNADEERQRKAFVIAAPDAVTKAWRRCLSRSSCSRRLYLRVNGSMFGAPNVVTSATNSTVDSLTSESRCVVRSVRRAEQVRAPVVHRPPSRDFWTWPRFVRQAERRRRGRTPHADGPLFGAPNKVTGAALPAESASRSHLTR